MAQTSSVAETRMNWVRDAHTLAFNLQEEICRHPAYEDLAVQEAQDVNLVEWDAMLDEILELAMTFFTQPTKMDEKQSYVELWMKVDDVYNSMSSHMANPYLTEGRRFICEHSAIETAYNEFRMHRFVYWEASWGMEFDYALLQGQEDEL